jgi:hypothetical protein
MEHKIKANALAPEALPQSEAVGEVKGERRAPCGKRRYWTAQRKTEPVMEVLTKSTPTTEICTRDQHHLGLKPGYFLQGSIKPGFPPAWKVRKR